MIDQAKALDIIEVAGRLGIVANRNLALCPFHDEKSPSFHFTNQNRFWCFGCSAKGDSIDLVMKLSHLDFKAAIAWLMGSNTTAPIPARPTAPSAPTRYIHPYTYRDAWHTTIPGNYLQHKGLVSETFGVRLCTPATAAIIPDLRPGGLIIPYYQNGYITYARWRNADPACDPKYKMRGPKGVPLRLFGQDSLLRLKTRPGTLYICESETDAMTLDTLGLAALAFPGSMSVGSNGPSAHCHRLLQVYAGEITEIVDAFDSDNAGREGWSKFIKFLKLIEAPFETRSLDLGGFKDVNDAYQGGLPLE